MASLGDTSGAVEMADQDWEKPSPSQSLLQRLKMLREWQGRQQEVLMRGLAHTTPLREPVLTPLKEETLTRFSESTETEDSTPPPYLVSYKAEDHQTTVGLPEGESASPVAPTSCQLPVHPPKNLPEKVEVQSGQSVLRDQLPDNHDSGELGLTDARMRQANHPIQANETNEWQVSPLTSAGSSMSCTISHIHQEECDARNEYDNPHNIDTREDAASFFPSENPSDLINDSMEDLLGLEKQKPYRSEKYESLPLSSKECLKKTIKSSEAGKDFAPSKSFFCTVTQGPDDGSEGMEETPKPKHRFLRKGEGTSRFGMRPMRLRMSKTEAAGESSCLLDAATQNIEVPHTASPPAAAPTKGQFRLPMQTLQLQEVPKRTLTFVGDRVNSMDHPVHGGVRHRPSPVPVSTHPTMHGPTSTLPGPLNLEKQQRREEDELSAFERLEELAEDSSFSSNSSTVLHLLKQGQQSVSSTPLRTPPPLAFQETPVVGSLGVESKSLAAESHSAIEDLINRALPSHSGTFQHQQQAAVNVKEVLAQLKAIVRLEGHSISNVTESDIQSFLEGCSNQYLSDVPHHTSTPAPPQPLPPTQARPHHVRFASEGVQVMEYERSDTDGEDTLTDAASLDSDLITTSDLEALTQLSVRGGFGGLQRQQQMEPTREGYEGDSSSSSEVTLTEQEAIQGEEPVVLTFSPPPPRPPQSASNYIWSIFGKERDSKKKSAPKGAPGKAKKTALQQPPTKPKEIERSVAGGPQPDPDGRANQELEIHKTLILAKVAELEKETKLFQKENSKLQRLQQQAQEERQKLEEEKHRLQEEAATERRRFQEYVDRERNALWREKQQVIQKPALVTQPQEHVMEMVRLREQIREMREEAERKESLNQFTVKKLSDRIKTLENENKKLKDKNNSLQALEKENQDLRLKVDRARVSGRVRPATQPTKSTRGRPKSGIRCTTVDGVAKMLDKMAKPQPVIVKEAQSKTKQDLANNNLNLGATESDEVVLAKQGSNTKAESTQASVPNVTDTAVPAQASVPTVTDMAVPVEDPASPPAGPLRHSQASLLSPEEARLEHTERLREDGVQEVIFANGNRKEIHPSGEVIISFYNGDRKEIHTDRVVYVYGNDLTRRTTYSSGKEEIVFPNGQHETFLPDGSSEVSFPNGSRKSVLSDGTEICTVKDGSVVRTNPDGSQVVEFPSGQREVYCTDGEKRREYPDGTVKILHPDGRTETRYYWGRTRIKDKEGNLILDTDAVPPLLS